MNRKQIITILAIVLYAIAAGASDEYDEGGWIFVILILCIVVPYVIISLVDMKNEEERQKAEAERARNEKVKADLLEAMKEDYSARMVEIEREYGQPVQIVCWGDSWDKECNISHQFMVFDSTKKNTDNG